MPPPEPRTPVAVVGISALFPGSTDAAGFWRDIVTGRDLITDVPATHWLVEDYYDPDPAAPDKTYARRGAFLSPVEFDPLEHGVPPTTVPATDTSQLLALILAKQVLADATRGQFAELDRDRVSVILGLTSAQELLVEMAGRLQRPVWVKALREHGLPEAEVQAICDRIAESYVPWQENTFPGLLGNVVAGRIANRLDLGGTNCVTDAACASALSALSMGLQELYLGDSDLVITGGVETFNDIFMYMCFSRTPTLSPTGDCRPFDADADGTMLGEGLGFLALRRLADAERDGNRIYAVIRGLGSASDGRATSVYAPVPEGQAKALRRAYQAAGYGPDTVELVEAHGTGTRAGDAAEFQALRTVFDETGRADRQWCALGSVKSQVGHTKAAAGAAGLLKVILALHHKVLPPTLKVTRPNPALEVESSPFHLNSAARPWVRGSALPRRASVSAFGFGGSNFHVTCEEHAGAVPRADRFRTTPTELVVAAAADPWALAAECRRLCSDGGGPADGATAGGALAEVARASRDRADPGQPARLAVVAGDLDELGRRLEQAAQAMERSPEAGFSAPGVYYAFGSEPGKLALLFPGQGSQYVAMGADLAIAFDAAREVWDRAADLRFGDAALPEVVFPPPAFTDQARDTQVRRLTATEWAQPAIGATSVAQLALLRVLGLRPACVGGHSFGEMTALHAAGVLDEETLLRLARRRGELMAAGAVEPGAMLAVRSDVSGLVDLLEPWNGTVVVANHNGPRQVVLSGPVAAIDELSARLREGGVAAWRLPVATAFHSPLVGGARRPFLEFLESVRFTESELPVYANATTQRYPSQPDAARKLLAEQISLPVRFAGQVDAMYDVGARTFLEVGPGAVLTGLVDDCLAGRPHRAVSLDRPGRHGLTSLWDAVGQLWAAGVPMELCRLSDAHAPVPAREEKRKPALSLVISGTNYGRPYPPPGGAAALPPPNPPRATATAPPPMPSGTAAPVTPASTTPPAAPVTPASTTPPAAAPEWIRAYEEMQRQTAEAHTAYQRAMAESHTAFLRAAETSYATLAALAGGAAPPAPPAPLAPVMPQPPVVPQLPVVPRPAAVPEAPAVLQPPVVPRPAAVPEAPAVPPVSQPAPVSPAVAPAHVDGGGDLARLLVDVVADKTGFPSEMLTMSMDLQADLGIDSIKRVEILSTLQRAVPSLPQLGAPEIAALRTLGHIAERLAGAASPEAPAGPGRYIVRTIDAPRTGDAAGLSTGGPLVVTDEGTGVAPALVATLRSRGLDARLDEIPPDTAGLVFLGGLRDVADEAAALAVNREAFSSARVVARRFASGGGFLVTVQDTGGDFGLSGRAGVRAWLGGLPALAKTAAQEWPAATVKAIDIERGDRTPDALAEALAEELISGAPEREVGLSAGGRRLLLETVQSATVDGPDRLGEAAVVVASGGARGVTAAALRALARVRPLRIALLGRTRLRPEPPACHGIHDRAELGRVLLEAARSQGRDLTPAELRGELGSVLAAREIEATLDDLRAAGCDACYLTADVRDGAAVAGALERVRARWGPVTALVHAAGVIEDGPIAQKPLEQFDRVFDPKCRGLRTLLDATRADPLRAIVLFSSVAARTGNAGQADYAMANEVLNQVAAVEARERPGCLVRSLNWGPWDGGMVSPELSARFTERGVPLIPMAAGAAAFLAELRDPGDTAQVVLGAAPPGASAQ